MCFLNGIDFNNNRYSSQDEINITIENFKLLIRELNCQIKANDDKMTVAIDESFKRLLEQKLEMFDGFEKY